MLYSFAVLAMQAAAPQAEPPAPLALTMQQQTALRCSIAIAMGAERQRTGGGDADWPDLTERGREFFVRSLAQLMDDTGMSREALMQAAAGEAADLQDGENLHQVMPACLLMLNASGL
ncbi:hypothetical protein E3U23_13235 [Erythrobacter litoralis]|nr:hypothetical protein [Erythrobacter litoralis]